MALFTKLKPKWRWLQFSMRTVLVVVGVLCVALSLWVVPAERQRRAVAAIEAPDGSVFYVDNQAASESFLTTYLRRWLPQDYLDEVDCVFLPPLAPRMQGSPTCKGCLACAGHGCWTGRAPQGVAGLPNWWAVTY